MFPFRSARRRYDSPLVDRLPVGVVVYDLADPADDASLRVTYANEAAAAVPGLATDRGARAAETLGGVPLRARCAAIARGEAAGPVGTLDADGRTVRVAAVPLPGHAVGVVFETADGETADGVAATSGAANGERVEAAPPPAATAEARYQTLFDALADPVLVYPIGPDGPEPILAVNEAAVRMYGYSPAEFAAMTVDDLLMPGSLALPDALDRLRRTRQATFDSLHRTRDGRSVPVQTSARLVELDGQLCVLALARDDSERRAFQRDLSRANLGLERTVEERTAALQTFADALRTVQNITAGAFETGQERTAAYLRAGCEMLAMPIGIASATPLDDATGERLYRIEAIVSPDPALTPGLTVPIGEAFCDAVLERGETVVYGDAAESEATSCHPAYATRGLRAFIGTPVRIDGDIVGTINFVSPEPRAAGFQPFERDLVEIIADAVARRLVADRAEEQRRHTEDYYRTVVETIEDGIVTLDAECRITMSNPSARLLLGLQPEARHDAQARAQGLDTDSGGVLVPAASGTERGGETDDLSARWPVVGEDGRPIAPADLPERRVLTTGRAVRGDIQGIVHPDGSVRWYRVNAAPIDHDGDGTPEAIVLSYTDITDFRPAAPAAAPARATA